ncbi:MFS family permease [Nocardioides luteus]|uniref:MFS transporter n=1 Tax=Nocardioides luteus TaxID=1844 RepID=A0ABQ5SVW1_9ACTN|nr:MFS transporter [Nocardioides luteus]MDR7312076.1 MFS family permease [Nocardioides luteus]GGR55927.1 MFS transporter [Nocardioides luteus]GLJ68323.1 MFS transporter [Nocardioides luteus]
MPTIEGPSGRRTPLRHPSFRRLVTGTASSSLGNAITPVALAFAVLDLGGTATQLGLVEAVFAACQVVTTLAGGVLGDRVSRKLMMEGTAAISAVVIGSLAATVILGVATIPSIAVMGGLAGVVAALNQPSAMAMTKIVVPEEDLGAAISLRSLLQTTASTVGYALGGVLVAAVGSGWAITVDAVTFAIAAVAYSGMQVTHDRGPRKASMLTELGEGFREVMRHAWLWFLILQALLYHLFWSGAHSVLGPIVVGEGIGRESWGFALAALMAGFIVGGLFCLRFRPRRLLGVGVFFLAMTGLFPVSMALSETLWPILLGAFLHGFGLQVFDVFWQIAIQQEIPEKKLSRVYAFDIVGSFVARPVGLALVGPVAVAVGFDTWLLVVAAVISGTALMSISFAGVRRLERAPERVAVEEAA